MLSEDYTGAVDEERFVADCVKLKWRVRNLEIGTIVSGRDHAYAPVRAISVTGGMEHRIDSVVFFRKSGETWKMMNFPLLNPHLPEFVVLPEWLR